MSDDCCHWVAHRRRRVFIPGCYGGMLHGPEGCTCREHGNATTHERIVALERRVALLERKLEKRA